MAEDRRNSLQNGLEPSKGPSVPQLGGLANLIPKLDSIKIPNSHVLTQTSHDMCRRRSKAGLHGNTIGTLHRPTP